MEGTYTIIGGGIAGLTAALALQKICGIQATVMEAAPEFKPVGAGVVLAANAMRVYKLLGIYDELVKAGNNVNQFTFYDEAGRVITRTNTAGLRNSLDNFTIHRAELHKVLLQQLKPDNIITGKRTRDLIANKDGYTIFFNDGSNVDAEHVIVAEGVHSPIRQKLLPQSKIRYAGYTCWRGITNNTTETVSETFETWGTRGRFGVAPLAEGKIYWFACKNATANNETFKGWGVNELYDNFKTYHSPIGSIIRSTPADQIIWNDIIDLKPIHQYAFGNLVLIGDSAHATTPNMGQGACQAIEDAIILANCLKNNTTAADAFKAFEQKRLKRTHYIVEQSWLLGKVAQLDNPLLSKLRDLLFKSLPQKFYQKQVERVYNVRFD